MERTMIAWNFVNWITIVLMAAAGYAVLAIVAQVLQNGLPTPGNNAGGY